MVTQETVHKVRSVKKWFPQYYVKLDWPAQNHMFYALDWTGDYNWQISAAGYNVVENHPKKVEAVKAAD